MIETFVGVGVTLGYFLIGTFISALLSGDEMSMVIIIFWPVALALIVVLFPFLGVAKLGQWLHDRFNF